MRGKVIKNRLDIAIGFYKCSLCGIFDQGITMIDLVSILGHTAGGKTAFAAHLARRLDGEIISADSRQVYRGMDIGTGKDYVDYLVDGREVPVHLLDIADAGSEYNVHFFKKDFRKSFLDISQRGKMPVMCGGTGMYIEAVLKNYRLVDVPVNHSLREELESESIEVLESKLKQFGPLHNRTDMDNRKRLIRAIEIARYQTDHPEEEEDMLFRHPLIFGIRFEREARRARITQRLRERIELGMVKEVEGLMKQGVSAEIMDYYGLEYRYISKYLQGEFGLEEMHSKLKTAIHQFAKRQMTYFRGMERRGIQIHWLQGELAMEEKLDEAIRIFKQAGKGLAG